MVLYTLCNSCFKLLGLQQKNFEDYSSYKRRLHVLLKCIVRTTTITLVKLTPIEFKARMERLYLTLTLTAIIFNLPRQINTAPLTTAPTAATYLSPLETEISHLHKHVLPGLSVGMNTIVSTPRLYELYD